MFPNNLGYFLQNVTKVLLKITQTGHTDNITKMLEIVQCNVGTLFMVFQYIVFYCI